MTSWLNHKALRIMKGIGKYPTDTNSAENNPVVVDLMSGVITLDTDGWSPNIPTVKNGGVWTESPTTDGRSLIAAAAGNVTEKMTLNITDKAYLSVMKAFESLGFMAASCRDFWQTQDQIDPVYLMWAAGCNMPPLPQYAILYNIELVPDYLDSPNQPTIRVAMTLEREPYWRGIPPGMNPKMWTFYVNGQQIGLGTKVLADATLVSGSDHLITQTIQNKSEWAVATYGLQSTFLSQNFIDIPASLVPGDAPALVEVSVISATGPLANLYIAHHSKPQSGVGHDGITRVNSLILNGGDGAASGLFPKISTGSAATGVHSNGSAVNYYNLARTSTGVDAIFNTVVQWGANSGTNLIRLDRNFFRGTFAVFCRCRNVSAVGPTTADMRIRLTIEQFENNANQYSTIFTSQDVNPSASGAFMLSYMGVFTIPFENRAAQSLLGYGLQLQESNPNLRVTLLQKVDVATANRTFEMIDLIFMPIDEELAQVVLQGNSSGLGVSTVLLDNTGYLLRGELIQMATAYMSTVLSGGIGQEVRGAGLYLKPHINQRLYFINDFGVSSISSIPSEDMTVRLNIVPRWSSIRDV